MFRNRLLFILLLLVASLFMVSPALAQETSDINPEDLLEALGPRDGNALIFDILLYLIFFFGFINTFLIPDKQLAVSLMNFLVMGLALVSKLLIDVGGEEWIIDVNPSAILVPGDFAVLPINVGIFVVPLLMAGMLRSVKGKRSPALFPCLIMGLLGGTYFFIFWATEQRPLSDIPRPGDFEAEQGQPGTMLFFTVVLAGYYGLRRRFLR